jgi:VanZ family protein
MIKLLAFLRPFAKYILAVWVIMVIALSSTPNLPTLKIHTAKADIRLDYLIHICEYSFLALMAYLSFLNDDRKEIKTYIIRYSIVTAALVLFAFADEYHQLLIPGRTFNPMDLLSNIAGIAAALIFSLLAFKHG